ncbi:MFS transporter [Rudaeicoccus suwonensis]|uniref:Putative MFS family arabinose efflux permease n=1 Tax=Rudaeicoccus suwonensis TaxID=657409 RepID=A0A561E7U1_9MICO|nr:MFS transporter [Rudaeicoccus suwonensis]TWE11685.1 putative MFS family arabinose efflux permease [Rudaeicoccus suwonensis]
MSRTFASLSVFNYRAYFTGALISNVGTWMGRTAQDWLVLTQLTNHNSTDLGIVTALQFAPVVVLAPMAGALTDRFSKRKVLYGTQTALLVTSGILAALVVGGVVQLWHVYLLALLQGVATALDNPSRQAFVSEMVPPEKLSNAVGLNATSFNAARLIGPGIAGLMIGLIGTGKTLIFNTLSFVAVLIALKLMRGSELRPAPRARGKGKVREGLVYVRHRPDLILVMAMVFMLGTFGMNFQITIALMATTVFHKGAAEYGLLGSIMAIGSLAGALMAARRERPRLRIVLIALAGFTIASALAAMAPSYLLFGVFLIPTGLCAITMMNTSNATVQLSVAPEMRGRVMALYMAIFMGGTPIGSPVIGWIGTEFGARWTILVGSIATGITVVVAMIYLMRRQDVHLHVERRPVPHLHVSSQPATGVEPQQVA